MKIEQKLQDRRAFVKKSVIGAAGAMLLPRNLSLARSRESSRKKVGYALVGLGYYSTEVLAPALQETEIAYLAGIVTGTSEKEKAWAQKYGIPAKNIYNYENFDLVADNDEIDVIYVVLPNSMHREFTIRAARAGKHVICEKPMALNAGECLEMIEACRENNVLLSVGYRLHYDPVNMEAMRLGQEEVYGRVRQINCGAAYHHSQLNHWKLRKEMGGGALLDMGVYPLQAARYVTGEEPVGVTAQAVSLRDAFREVDEAVSFQLEFPGGALANLSTGLHAGFNYLHVSAERGRFDLQPFSGYRNNKGQTREGEMNFPDINQQAAHMDDMALSVLEGKPVRVPGEEGLRDLIIVDAAFRSMELNCSIPVDQL